MVGVIVALLASILGLLAALSIRELGMPRLILLCMLLPLFIPGVSMGLASALLFKILGIAPSLVTIVIVQTLWALPFATLIILTVMATFDPVYLEAAYMAGANRWQAFRDIEFPLIAPGIFGAASFSLHPVDQRDDPHQRRAGTVEHHSDLHLVDLQAGRPVARALCADGADHPRRPSRWRSSICCSAGAAALARTAPQCHGDGRSTALTMRLTPSRRCPRADGTRAPLPIAVFESMAATCAGT